MKHWIVFFVIIFIPSICFSYTPQKQGKYLSLGADTWAQIDRDIRIANYWHAKDFDNPTTYLNYYATTGYFVMPSARQGTQGLVGIMYSSVNPYSNYGIFVQPFNRAQASGVYRVFRGVQDLNLSPYGFGDYMDRGINFKINLVLPEDSQYLFPGLAYGMEDAWGRKKFHSEYIVATQVARPMNIELTLGWGTGRISGFFGGFLWIPLRRTKYWLLNQLALVGEIDATNYLSPDTEPHPDGRNQKSNFNYGIKYRVFNLIEASVSSIRGADVAWSVALNYDLGNETGLLPKVNDSPPYQAPVNYQSLGCYRSEEAYMQEIAYALGRQGFDLLDGWIAKNDRTIRINVINMKYIFENKAKEEMQNILARLVPDGIDSIIVVIMNDGLLTQQYTYRASDLKRYATGLIGSHEMQELSPRRDVDKMRYNNYRHTYKHTQDYWALELLPYYQNFFGNKFGKIKSVIGGKATLQGYLFKEIFYQFSANYVPYSDIGQMDDYDTLNPSQLLNVESDIVNYYQTNNFTMPQLYMQKSFNMTHGYYSRLAAGWFQINFAGLAAEMLYYPQTSDFGIGIQAAMIKKRNYSGLGFQNTIRYFDAKQPVYTHYDWLYQYSLNLYYNFRMFNLDIEANIGRFLATDSGFRFNFTRYFDSGLRLNFWIAFTNGKDIVNGARYFNSGVGLSMPLEIFLKGHSKLRWGYGMSPWLRDSGIMCETGKTLHRIIFEERVR